MEESEIRSVYISGNVTSLYYTTNNTIAYVIEEECFDAQCESTVIGIYIHMYIHMNIGMYIRVYIRV